MGHPERRRRRRKSAISPSRAKAAPPPAGATPDVQRSGVRRVLWLTLFLNLAVSGGKILVGRYSGSTAMVADGYHSLMDGSNNVVGLIAATFAYAPPDAGHPYGHRKFENAATVLIALALLGLAYEVVVDALSQVNAAQAPIVGWLNWVVMGVTLVINLWVSSYEAREGRRLGSTYLLADATHTRSDVYVTLGVLASFAGARAGVPWVDGLVAVGIAGFIALMGVRILIEAFHTLTDRAVLPPEEVARVVRKVPGVLLCRDVRTRGGSGAIYVDMTVHVDGELTLREAHDVSDAIEETLQRERPEVVDVVVHLEPAE